MAVPLFADRPRWLTGELVLLRDFTAADIEAMAAILADPEVIMLTGSAHTGAEVAAAVPVHDERTRQWYVTRAQQTDRLDLAIVDRASDHGVGEIVINEWSPHDRSANLRLLIGPEGRGRGLGTEAIRLVLDATFAGTDLHRIELEVYAFNPRARHVYASVGFREEGVRRDAFRFDGEATDAIVMAVLRPEWLEGRLSKRHD